MKGGQFLAVAKILSKEEVPVFLPHENCVKISASLSTFGIVRITFFPILYMLRASFLPQFSSVQFISVAQSCPTLCNPMDHSRQAYLSIITSWSLPKLMCIESVMPSNHLIFCHPLLLLPSIFPSIRVFSSESLLHIRWPKYWSFNFNISPSSEHSGLLSDEESAC